MNRAVNRALVVVLAVGAVVPLQTWTPQRRPAPLSVSVDRDVVDDAPSNIPARPRSPYRAALALLVVVVAVLLRREAPRPLRREYRRVLQRVRAPGRSRWLLHPRTSWRPACTQSRTIGA